jgi:phosphatidylserine/phosphatidylglycerophosphate/cardiolipin synthase-like enzyme
VLAVADPLLLITGQHFGRKGLRGVLPVMQELVGAARRELHLLAYVVTRSALPLIEQIDTALSRGIRATIVVNVIPGQAIELLDELSELGARYPHAAVRFFQADDGSQLHAKVLVCDRERAVLGSANYTWGGLVTNHEVGVLLDGRPAWELARLTDRLALESKVAPTI